MQSVQLLLQCRAVEESRVDLKAKMPRTGPEAKNKNENKNKKLHFTVLVNI